MYDVDFVDRDRELAELTSLADGGRPALALLFGRRRVGKTYLLDQLARHRRSFYYLAADTTGALNRRELLGELRAFHGRDIDPEDFPTWRAVFRLLLELTGEEPLLVVLDEFQYLLGGEDDVASQLVAVWDRELEGRRLVLVLCGSEVGTMERLQSGGSPLYGRIDWAARLRPFDYFDAARMLPRRGPRERAVAYGVFGGTPRFLSAVRPGDDLSERIRRAMLSARGEVHLQLGTLIQQEKGIRDPGDYQAVLSAIASGRTLTHEIAAVAGLHERQHVVRRALETLESLLLVRRERNFRSSQRTPWRNRIADNAVAFWYRFVQPQRARLDRGEVDEIWTAEVEPRMNDYMGWSVFEGIVAEGFLRHHERWGLPAPREWARWEGQDRNRRAIEIDIAAELDDGRVLTGEVKWSTRPVDTDLHFELRRDLQDLAASGQAWAHEALDPARSAGHLYVSAGGFTPHFQARAKEEGNVRLIDLEMLYEGVETP
jgi:hypothetical protein